MGGVEERLVLLSIKTFWSKTVRSKAGLEKRGHSQTENLSSASQISKFLS